MTQNMTLRRVHHEHARHGSMEGCIWLNIRTEVGPENGDGCRDAHQHQDACVIEAASAGPCQAKGFDSRSLAAICNQLRKEVV